MTYIEQYLHTTNPYEPKQHGKSFTTTYTVPNTIVDALSKRGIGFKNQFSFFEELLNTATSSKYPPYDILSIDKDTYEIRFAVAGFTKDEIGRAHV